MSDKKYKALYRCGIWKEKLFKTDPRKGGSCGNFGKKCECLLKRGQDDDSCDATKLPIHVGATVYFRNCCQHGHGPHDVEAIMLEHFGVKGIFCQVDWMGKWWPMDSLMTEEEWKQNNDIARD